MAELEVRKISRRTHKDGTYIVDQYVLNPYFPDDLANLRTIWFKDSLLLWEVNKTLLVELSKFLNENQEKIQDLWVDDVLVDSLASSGEFSITPLALRGGRHAIITKK